MPEASTLPPPPAAKPRPPAVDGGDSPARVPLGEDHWAVEVRSPRDVGQVAAEWDDLTAHAAAANVFLDREVFTAGWSAFGDPTPAGDPVSVVLIVRRPQASQFPATPVGLFAVTEDRSLGRVAGPVLSLWSHDYAFDSTPLLREGHTADAVRCFLDWCEVARPHCRLVRFDGVAAEGPLMRAVHERLSRRTAVTFEVERHNRALLRPRASAESYIEAAVSARTRRELRRQERRLREVGEVETAVWTHAADADAFVDRFLALEGRGWKGGTAMAGDAAAVGFFRRAVRSLAAADRFEGFELTLDGRPVAMKADFLSAPAADGTVAGAAFKIAYDETFAKFSPGVMLELEAVRRLHETGRPHALDSCAKASHPMIDRLWGDRAARTDFVVSLGGWRGDVALGVKQLLRWVQRRFRPRREDGTRTNF